MRANDKGLQKERSGLGNQGQCKHSPGPDSTCHPGEQQRERQAPGRLHTGREWAPFLSRAPQDLGRRGATASSLLRWSGPRFCAQLAGSVAASAEGTAGLESWGTFGVLSGWGRPGEILCWVKRSGAPARAWRLSTSGWDPPPGRPARPPRSSLTLNSSTPPLPNPQLQFTTGCSGAPPIALRFRLGTSGVRFELQGLGIKKSKQDHRCKYKITRQSHFNGGFMLG